MQILNKPANMRDDICYRVSDRSKVRDTNIEEVKELIFTSEELSKENKSVSNVLDFTEIRKRTRSQKLIRVRKLEDEKRAGFALVGSITVIGILVMGIVIFMAAKAIVFG